jgi:hypothetical protein
MEKPAQILPALEKILSSLYYYDVYEAENFKGSQTIMRGKGNKIWVEAQPELYSETQETFADLPPALKGAKVPELFMKVHELMHIAFAEQHTHLGEQNISVEQHISTFELRSGFNKKILPDIFRLTWDSNFKQMYNTSASPFNKENVSFAELQKHKINYNESVGFENPENYKAVELVAKIIHFNNEVKAETGKPLWSMNNDQIDELKGSFLKPSNVRLNPMKFMEFDYNSNEFKAKESTKIPDNQVTILQQTISMMNELNKGSSISLK